MPIGRPCNAAEADDNVGRKTRLNLEEILIVEQAHDHVAHVVAEPWVPPEQAFVSSGSSSSGQ